MAMRKCPECKQSVKLENLRKHYANVHPGKDPSAAISESETRQVQRSKRKRAPAFYTRRPVQAGMALIVIVVAAYFGLPYVYHGGGQGPPAGWDLVADCGQEGQVTHYHPLLVIHHNGSPQAVSANIGITNAPGYTNPNYYCTGGGLHVLHTHDTSGIIHVEIPYILPSPPTLGQFFQIWGEPLNSGTVWQWSGAVSADMYNTGTGVHSYYSTDPGTIPLYQPPQGPAANPYSMPAWTGSSGAFSGEIIWLNVTG